MRAPWTPFLLLALLACTDDGTGPEGPVDGEFTAQVSGDVQRTIEGVAVFEINVGEEFFAVTMDNEGSEFSMTVVLDRTTRPGPGTYPFTDFDSGSFADVVFNNPGGNAVSFTSTTGQLVITSSSSQQVTGSVTLEAEGRSGPGNISVSATFTSVCKQTQGTACD